MTRTVSSVISAAIVEEHTTPVYLIRMGWTTEKRVATWDVNIPWNSETWEASGAEIDGLDITGGTLLLPNGSTDPWLSLVQSETARGRSVQVYEYHTSTGSPAGSDAELLFTGIMDESDISDRGIRITLIESQTAKGFPPTSIGPPTYNWLLTPGSRLFWGPDIVTIN